MLLERTVQQHIGAHVMELVMCIPRGVILQTACANAVQTEPPALDFEDARLSVTGIIYPHKSPNWSNCVPNLLPVYTFDTTKSSPHPFHTGQVALKLNRFFT